MPNHWTQRATLIPLSVATIAILATPATRATSQNTSEGSSVREDLDKVSILGRTGPRIRIQNRTWVSGTVIELSNDVTIRITDLGHEDSGAVITDGDVQIGDRLEVRAISVQLEPLYVGGVLPPLLRAILRELREQLPIVFVEEGQNLPPDLLFEVAEDRLEVLSRDGSLRHQFPLGTGVEARVLALIQHEVALRQLSVLDNPLAPFGVELMLLEALVDSPDGKRFHGVAVGRELTVKVKSDRSGYLTLLNLSPDGSVDLLTPNLYGQTFLEGGTEVIIPDPTSDVAFRVEYPTGIGLLRALVTPTPLKFATNASGATQPDLSAFFVELQEQLGVFLNGSRVRMEHDSSATWSSALTLYHVFDPY